MAKKDRQTCNNKEEGLSVQGEVISTPGGGFYHVKTELDTDVRATLSGKMKQCKIRVVIGDRVTVELSPYDVSRGRITYRER